ncbi:hypothetical protein ONZ43_g229 [Nemania bipapillata]|uniref:Uncharacterized protein n=1 Tax=Nemania bipapillata TaxID=110536 RepID=A0ACC2J9B4_9PEZI|nr:hypothetical protein ONZ43_g229 [Nemania bipapillata]
MMKLLAISSLLAGAAQAFQWVNDFNYASYHTVGDNFTIHWVPEARDDTFLLQLTSSLYQPTSGITGPYYNFTSIDLADVKYSDGAYTWTVNTIDGREGTKWFYSFLAYYADESFFYSRDFYVQSA